MKIKTFILTFLMMMSSPFLFGQQHWTDPGGSLGYQNSMTVYAQVKLGNVVQTNDYQVAAFHGDQLLAVSEIIPFQGTTSNYHVHLQIYGDNSMGNIYFKFFNGTKEYVSETEFPFEVNVNIGDHPNYSTIDFYSVAQIGDVVYPTLQKAIDACKEGDNTIELLAENAEDVTIKQVEGVNVTIDGGTSRYNYSGTITIHGNARYQGEETLTFKNIDFTTNEAGHYFIDSNSTGSVERYAHNVTVLDCKFTATDAGVNSAVAMRIRQGFDIAINGGTFTDLHSALQAYGNAGITVSDITLIGKNGISAGTSTGVVIENSNITATGYGVRADGEGAYTMTLTDNTISAELPVVVRYVKEVAYNLTIAGDNNNYTASNENAYQVVFTTDDDGTYEAPTTGQFVLTVPENFNVYPVYVAELKNGKKYITFDEAYTAATDGNVINLLRTVVLDDSKKWWNYSTKQITVEAREINPAFRVQSGRIAMVNFGSMTINSYDGYCIIVGSSDGSIDANVDIIGGTYNGITSAISVTKGTVNIQNGTFNVEPYQGSYEFTINCYDPSYKNGTADVSIEGGKFYNFNPQNNAAEGAGTDFLTARYAAVQDADGYWNVVPAVAMIEHKDSKDKYYATLPDAVAAAKDGETVTLIKDATGAGLVINKNVTVDFGGKTYTINQAVGSTGTESQGFQLLKEATEVTLTNGNIAVAEGTNVVWMINDYSAKLNVTGLTFDCENMKWEKAPNVYFLVANNAHKQNPAVTLENVTVNNFKAEAGSPYYMEPETTIASSDANLDIEVDPGYRVVYNEGVYSVEKLVANFGDGKGAYARFVESKNREHFSLNVYDVYAKESLVVKVYHNETLLVTTTLREYDLDDENKKYYPYTSGAKGITVNNVVNLNEEGCKPAGSWLNEWEVEPTIENVPNRYEVYVDGVLNSELDLTANEFAGFSKEEELQTYLGFKSVYKQASITRGEDVTYYMTFDEALEAQSGNEIVKLVKDATGAGLVINKNVTVDFGGKTYTINQAVGSTGTESQGFQLLKEATEVTLTNGNIAVAEGTNVVWMINDYSAELNVKDLTFDCENMKWEKAPNVYFLVANNAHKQNPAVTLENVTVNNFKAEAGSPYYMEPETTIASSDANLDIEVDPGYVVEYEDGVYSVVAGNILNQTTGKKYATLQAAIDEASANDLIVLLANVTEDVTVNKSLTINGKAEEGAENSEYTGTMTIPAQDLNINVQNIDFVKGGINKPEKYIGGTLTVKDCTFDGANSISYAITVRSGEELTIENSTAKNYKTGMLYVPNSVTAINIKDVEVSNVAAAFNITYSGDATFENVELGENVNYGIHFQIYGSRTYTVKNCDLKNATNPFWFWDKSNNTAKVTVVFEGNNDLGTKGITVNAGELKMATDATLTAAEGLTIEATEDGYVVEYEDGVYSVVAGNILNQTTGKKFATIQEAIDAAENGDKIVVLEDLTVGYEDAKSTFGGNYKTFFNVSGKTVTIDLNGKTVKAVLEGEETVYAMFSVENNGVLNVEDNTNDGHAIIESESAVYSLFTCYTDGKLNINSGNFRLNRGYDDNSGSGGMIYSQEDETVIVNGGKFILDNVGTSLNGSPWIFNAKGNNEQNIEVHGGTYNYNVFNQYRIFEVQTTKEYAIKYDGDEAGTWTVVPAVAWVNNQEKSGNWYTYELGYVTLAEAFAAAEDCNRPDFAETVTLLQNITLTEGITVNADQEVVLDLNGFTVSQEKECTKHYEMIRNNGTLTIKDSTEEAQGKISFEDTGAGDPNFGWGSYTIGNYGTLVVENGTIENISTQNPGNGQPNVHMYCAIQQGHGAVSTTINGGTISNQTYRSIRTNTGALVINGGNIIGQVWVQPNQGNATLEITDGEFTPTGNDGSSVFMTNEGENYTVTSASITGGFFNTKIGATDPTKEGVAGCVTGGTFTTAAKDNTNEALINENFAFVDNGDDTWTVMPTQEQTLVKGWNWYSSYLNITTENLLGALGTNGKSIVQNSTWSATYYGVNDGTDYGWGYESHIFDVSKMYMIQTSEACELALSGNLVDASEITITLNPGWNWIGYPSNVEVKLEDALDGLQPSHGDEIKTQGAFASYYDYEGQSMWLTYSFGNGNMKPTKGYMYNNTSGETKTFTYNIVPATTRGNNETEVATHYSVDYTKYPFNMTMVAVVDGAMDDNYEVAALVNGEVRGSARPVYVEVLDAYMLFLTISGDNVEEVSFKYYDLTTGEEYDLVNRIDYSNNAMVGSVNEPYVLSRGTTGIGEAAMSQVNIYPNPTTTGTEINLQTVCDTVEVFNALGVKVAEYQNVDSIDALETAGIYVIRITNDGNVQNCRLVVK